MSDTAQGPGWWIASDGRWYPPELHPSSAGQPAPSTDGLAGWAPTPAAPAQVPAFNAVPGYSPFAGVAPTTTAATRTGLGSAPARRGGRIGRGLRLVGVGFTMVRDEPGLMAVPVIAFVAQVAVIGVAALILRPVIHAVGAASSTTADGRSVHLSAGQWLVVVMAGVAVVFISVCSHATIISRVMARFHGQRISNAKAAAAALTKSPHLLAWAFINYVVVSLLRSISNRGIIGLVVGPLLRAGWMLASFFVVPVILFENRGAVSSIKRSVELCRERWGENVVGNSAFFILGFVAILVDVMVAVLLGAVFAPLGAVVGALGLASILLILTVASAAFNAALYWFAVTDETPGRYSAYDLTSAYRRRSRRSGAY